LKTRRIVLLTLIICLTSAGAAFAQAPKPASAIDPGKAQNIRQLFQVTNLKDLLPQLMSQFIASFKQAAPDVPEEFWDDFKKKMDVNELEELMIPVYDKYYNAEDIKGMLAFYNSPTGRKVITTMGPLTQEMMAVGQEWGKKKGIEVAKELQRRGFAPKSGEPK
jgi:hypothetical protein